MRTLLTMLTLFALVVVGCSPAPAAPTPTPAGMALPAKQAVAAPMPTSIPTQPSATPVAKAREPRGELRIAGAFLPQVLDPYKSANILTYGIGETLTRLTPDLKVQPWLAESVTYVNPTTWRVKLRAGARYHDGSPVTAQAVADCFREIWTAQPAASSYIDKNTRITVGDERTLTFETPGPNGAFPNNLTTYYFTVFRPGQPGVMTGLYKPVRLNPESELILEAFRDHWGGPPPLAKIQVRLMQDPYARALALQSGDADLAPVIASELVGTLPKEIEPSVVPSLRMTLVHFNHARPPFNEQAVREAFALGVDRAALNKIAFDGRGKEATTVLPPVSGIETVPGQRTDRARAAEVLENAGWRIGADGVREKAGQRLAVKLLSYPARAELTPMAVGIQAQLKEVGFDVKVEQVQSTGSILSSGEFDACLWSVVTYSTGDPLYAFNQLLITGGDWNYGKYSNPQLDGLVAKLRGEPDSSRRQEISRQIQEIIKVDVPHAYLVSPPYIVGYNKNRVANYRIHPNDYYLVDEAIAVK